MKHSFKKIAVRRKKQDTTNLKPVGYLHGAISSFYSVVPHGGCLFLTVDDKLATIQGDYSDLNAGVWDSPTYTPVYPGDQLTLQL